MKTFTFFFYENIHNIYNLRVEIQLSFCAASENSTTKIMLFITMALISVVNSNLQVFPEYQQRPMSRRAVWQHRLWSFQMGDTK